MRSMTMRPERWLYDAWHQCANTVRHMKYTWEHRATRKLIVPKVSLFEQHATREITVRTPCDPSTPCDPWNHCENTEPLVITIWEHSEIRDITVRTPFELWVQCVNTVRLVKSLCDSWNQCANTVELWDRCANTVKLVRTRGTRELNVRTPYALWIHCANTAWPVISSCNIIATLNSVRSWFAGRSFCDMSDHCANTVLPWKSLDDHVFHTYVVLYFSTL